MNELSLFVCTKVLLAFSGGLNSSAMLRVVHEVGSCGVWCVCGWGAYMHMSILTYCTHAHVLGLELCPHATIVKCCM